MCTLSVRLGTDLFFHPIYLTLIISPRFEKKIKEKAIDVML